MKLEWHKLLNPDKKVKKSRSSLAGRDSRTVFQKDYHRIISSSAFRRLQDKAQVFPLEKFDFARTRLTHSLETASIARSIGRDVEFLLKNKKIQGIKKDCSDIENILECAALIHDIGNPPFGHFGEKAIRGWFEKNFKNHSIIQEKYGKDWSELNPQQQNDFLKFDGNAQGLRTVTCLSKVLDENGLNLTYPLLHTILKYPWSSSADRKKAGYFYSENTIVDEIAESLGTKGSNGTIVRHPLTFLLEAADDITYLTHDLEDGAKKKYFSFDFFRKNVLDRFKDSGVPAVKEFNNIVREYEEECKKISVNEQSLYLIRRLKIYLQGVLISEVKEAFISEYKDIMKGMGEGIVLLAICPLGEVVEAIKEFSVKYIYSHKTILQNEIKGYNVIMGIMDELIPAVLHNLREPKDPYGSRIYRLISDSYRVEYEKGIEKSRTDANAIYASLRLAVDFLSGMTDSYALHFYTLIKAV